jgi:hypothetical protein
LHSLEFDQTDPCPNLQRWSDNTPVREILNDYGKPLVNKHKKGLPERQPQFTINAAPAPLNLMSVLLDTCGSQPGQSVAINRGLPGKKLLNRQGISTAGLIKAQQPATHGGNDLRLTANYPSFG